MGRVIVAEVCESDGSVRHRVRLDRWPVLVGRAYHADLLVDDPYVSPEHVRLAETADGAIEAEDLGSLNGLFTRDGTRVSRTTVAAGGSVRLGRTLLRLCPSDLPVPPALPDAPATAPVSDRATVAPAAPLSAHDSATPSPGRFRSRQNVTALTACVVSSLFLGFLSYLRSYQRTAATDSIYLVLALWLICIAWATGWALAGRLLGARARFLQHLAIVFLAGAAVEIVGELESWLAFLFPAREDSASLGVAALFIGISVALIAGHLTLVSASAARRRWQIACSVAAIGTAIAAFTGSTESKKFSSTLAYPVQIRPMPERLIPAESVADFIHDSKALRSQVDSLITR